ncbi:AbrB/MazE/SpoVT family DNA-binding domain-containing protein [Paraburkholderia jirisanensis]
MELSIQKWGNSAAVRLPTALLEQLKVALGDKLEVDVRAEGIMLKPARHKYALDDLVAQCDPKAPMPADLAAWNSIRPVGREAW